MVSYLIRRLVKDSENTKDPAVRRKCGSISCLVGIVLNVLLFVGKYFAGVLSGSVAIMADSFNNLSDAGSSVVTLLGFRLAAKKPDPGNPFGHGRMEYISGLVVAAMILVVGVELGRSSIEKIIRPQAVDCSPVAVGVLLVSIGVKCYMAYYNHKLGVRLDSSAMKATATDSLSDAIATAVVLLSMLVIRFTHINIDGICGVLVALFILKAGIGAAKEAVDPLLGQPADPEFVASIERLVMAHPEVEGIHDLVVHDYGPGRQMVSLHAEVPGSGDLFELHDAIDRIEKELYHELGCMVTVHMDPIATDDGTIAAMRREVSGAVKALSPELSIHDFRMVQGPTHTNLIFDVVVPLTMKQSDREIEEQIKVMVAEQFKNCFAVVQIDHPYV